MATDEVKSPKDIGDAGGLLGGSTTPIAFGADPKVDATAALARTMELVQRGDVPPTLEHIGRAMESAMRATPTGAPPPPRDPFAERATQARVEWFAAYPPSRRWLLMRPDDLPGSRPGRTGDAGFLPLGKVGVLAAAGGAGKTMALVQLALSVATGKPWLGTFTVPETSRGHVLLALGEEDAEEVRRRLHAAFAAMWPNDQGKPSDAAHDAMELAERRITILPLAGEPCAFVSTDPKTREAKHTEALAQMRAFLERKSERDDHGWSLIALDPLSRFAGAETETDSAAATRFVQAIESLVSVRGTPTVLVAHHTTKGSRKGDEANDTTAVRGSSALTDGVRWVATMMPEKPAETNTVQGRVFFELTKSNYGPPDKLRSIKRAEGGALVPLDGDDLRAEKERHEELAGAKAARTEARTKPSKVTTAPTAPKIDDVVGERDAW